ncbi:MAG: zinc-ribbon domain-containing protein [Bacteroidales bacterium]|nr:zinc-ribbon domain-containing protein [Bacteroidales bacterium]
MEEENKTLVICPNCGKKMNIPADKHIKFECPNCHTHFEFGETDIADDDESFLGNVFDWFCSFIIVLPLFAWIMNVIPDLDWVFSLDRILEFIVVYVIVGLLVDLTRWLLLSAAIVLAIILTVGTFKDHGYGFKEVYKDYVAFVYDIRHTSDDKVIPQGTIKIGDIGFTKDKRAIKDAIDYRATDVKQFANNCTLSQRFAQYAEKEPQEIRIIIHALAICDSINRNWNYVNDPNDMSDYYAKASETILAYKEAHKGQDKAKFTGDCDDHTILLSACIKAIGGKSVIFATERHLYSMLPIEQRDWSEIFSIMNKLYPSGFEYYKFDGKYWLNLDYTAKHAGGKIMDEKETGKLQFSLVI